VTLCNDDLQRFWASGCEVSRQAELLVSRYDVSCEDTTVEGEGKTEVETKDVEGNESPQLSTVYPNDSTFLVRDPAITEVSMRLH
jgi:hypothetical protein